MLKASTIVNLCLLTWLLGLAQESPASEKQALPSVAPNNSRQTEQAQKLVSDKTRNDIRQAQIGTSISDVDAHLKHLARNQSLTTLKLHSIDNDKLPLIGKISQLTELEISAGSGQFSKDGLTHLQNLKQLHSLSLKGKCSGYLEFTGLLPALRKLSLYGTELQKTDGITISACRQLKELNLENCQGMDNFILGCTEMPDLEVLSIRGSNLSDTGAEQLPEKFPGLTKVFLWSPDLQGNSLHKLANLKKLKQISINGDDLTTEGKANVLNLQKVAISGLFGPGEKTVPGRVLANEIFIDLPAFDSGDPESDEQNIARFERIGNAYVSGFRRIKVSKVEELRQLLIEASKEHQFDISTLGITRPLYEKQRSSIQALLGKSNNRNAYATLLKLGIDFDYEDIKNCLQHYLLNSTITRYGITIGGTPLIQLESPSLHCGLVPWIITVGPIRWASCDLAISRAVSKLGLPSDTTISNLLSSKSSFWTKRIWKDQAVWTYLPEVMLEDHAQEILTNLAESQTGWSRFELVKSKALESGYALSSVLHTRDTTQTIDSLLWLQNFWDGKPAVTWADLLSSYEKHSQEAEQIPWLKQWKSEGEARSVSVICKPKEEPYIPRHLEEKWKHQGLSLEPETLFLLKSRGVTSAVMLAASKSDQVMICILAHGAKRTSTIPDAGQPMDVLVCSKEFEPEEIEHLDARNIWTDYHYRWPLNELTLK